MVDFKAIETKWQKEWEKNKIFEVKDNSKKKKYTVIEMFPYPSGTGLHMGHALNYTIGDIFARFKRMNGFNVLYPMGYDAFGLPAENAAIKANEHPMKYTENSMNNFVQQQKALGLSYDWSRKVVTCHPEYYKWNQYFFLKFYENGLVYRKKSAVNWCPRCTTVLANEQVHSGKCWRHEDTDVEIKQLEQWFIKTTKYSDELLEKVKNLDWPERIKIMQENWIGKSYGTEIFFEINGEKWPVFTTRADTLYGVTFLVVAAQHQNLMDLVTKEQKKDVETFLKKVKSVSEKDNLDLEKEGVFTGSYAVNPLTKEKVPVYAGNFVIADYGSGMVMAVPGHDQRDFEFAKKYNLPIKEVIVPNRIDIKNPPIKGKVSKERKNVHAIVRNPKNGKILFLKSHEFKWITLPMGGVEGNESVVEAAKREVKEESGYTNLKFLKVLGGMVRAEYFAKHKDENRVSYTNAVMFDLIDEKKVELPKAEQGKHEVMWIDKKDVVYPYIVHAELNDWLRRWDKDEEAYTDSGLLINSDKFNNLNNEKAKEEITKYLESKKIGRKTVNYKFRDWLVSRQRYWGTPIPIVYCDKCGIVPVPEKDLPIKLPEKVKFGEGNPLATNKTFLNVKCPRCKSSARRETDTMDTFFDSSWYFLRYCDNLNGKKPFDIGKVKYWMPVDQYIGGAEHACMHLIYARFFTKALRDLGMLDFDEPFISLFNQGMLHGSDGNKMSKSLGNVINPLEMIEKASADSLRFNLMSLASADKDSIWSDSSLESSHKWLNKVAFYFENVKLGHSSKKIESKLHKKIKEITEDIKDFKYNNGIIKIRKLFDYFEEENEISKEHLEIFLKLLHPICPHLTEELWNKLGNKSFISLESWPKFNENKIDDALEYSELFAENLFADIRYLKNILKMDKINKIIIIVSSNWKYKLFNEFKEIIKETKDFSSIMKKLMPNFKEHGQELSKLLPKLIEKQPEVVLNQNKEIEILKEIEIIIEKDFNCEVVIENADKFKHEKSKFALPGKPALLIE